MEEQGFPWPVSLHHLGYRQNRHFQRDGDPQSDAAKKGDGGFLIVCLTCHKTYNRTIEDCPCEYVCIGAVLDIVDDTSDNQWEYHNQWEYQAKRCPYSHKRRKAALETLEPRTVVLEGIIPVRCNFTFSRGETVYSDRSGDLATLHAWRDGVRDPASDSTDTPENNVRVGIYLGQTSTDSVILLL